ncbi:unnamed protein product [Mycena citricolor]|uniref:Nucleolar protein 2 n=1 Tax=Mycena citricolor TaxID=2018698 RepID=A0AAD2HKP0_9AGAR|nr:unnamed protein product [Mycena citricolor]
MRGRVHQERSQGGRLFLRRYLCLAPVLWIFRSGQSRLAGCRNQVPAPFLHQRPQVREQGHTNYLHSMGLDGRFLNGGFPAPSIVHRRVGPRSTHWLRIQAQEEFKQSRQRVNSCTQSDHYFFSLQNMGRRAKNKQGPPEPYDPEKYAFSKKLGKRKADDSEERARPAKKSKESGATNASKLKPKAKPAKKASRPKPTEDSGSGDGWEDVADGAQIGDLDSLLGDDDDDMLRGPAQEFDFGSDAEDPDDMPPTRLNSRAKLPNGGSSDDSDEEDDEEERVTMANMEARSRALDLQAAAEAELDIEEAQLAAVEADDEDEDVDMDGEEDANGDMSAEPFTLPTAEEREAEKIKVPDVHTVQRRMRQCVRVLGRFKKLAEAGRARSEYIQQLIADIASYYGYNEFLTEKLFHLFSVPEAIEFFEANEVSRPVTIRTNTLRTRRRDLAQALVNRGVNLEPIGKWTNVGLQIFESSVPIGATPEYLAGHYMLQAASSFLPVIALSPQPNERVLDMASAPGGKSTHIAALLQNTGVVFANDANKARTKSLSANVHRLGCTNVVVCSYDGREFPKVMGGFDRVLLDAPCSGTGVISKDASVKTNKASSLITHLSVCCTNSLLFVQSDRDFTLLSHLQKQLILCAIDSVSPESKTGGYLVYSTCSVMVDENEAVVDYALRKRPNVQLVETGLGFGVPGFTRFRGKTFHSSVSLTRRFYPHVHNMDGFFVAKFKVEKRAKRSKAVDEDDGGTVEVIAEDGTVENPVIDEQVGFDPEEDEPYLQGQQAFFLDLITNADDWADAKRRRMKAKGLRPSRKFSKATA